MVKTVRIYQLNIGFLRMCQGRGIKKFLVFFHIFFCASLNWLKIIWDLKFFWPQIISRPKIVPTRDFLDPKIFLPQLFFGRKFSCIPFFFGPKTFLDWKLCCSRIFSTNFNPNIYWTISLSGWNFLT